MCCKQERAKSCTAELEYARTSATQVPVVYFLAAAFEPWTRYFQSCDTSAVVRRAWFIFMAFLGKLCGASGLASLQRLRGRPREEGLRLRPFRGLEEGRSSLTTCQEDFRSASRTRGHIPQQAHCTLHAHAISTVGLAMNGMRTVTLRGSMLPSTTRSRKCQYRTAF